MNAYFEGMADAVVFLMPALIAVLLLAEPFADEAINWTREKQAEWFAAFPEGVRYCCYVVCALAATRPYELGFFGSMEEAVERCGKPWGLV